MNSVNLIGRIAKDIDLRKTTTGKSVITLTIAVPNNLKDEKGNKGADFLQIVVWDKPAEFIAENASKGARVSVTGSIRTKTYEFKGETRYTTEIFVTHIELLDFNNKKETE